MKIDFENAKIYVRPGSTDLRKGVTGLAQIIENEMKLNALSESIFLFCNKSHKLLKVIFWNKTGFWIAQKRLERANCDTFFNNNKKNNKSEFQID